MGILPEDQYIFDHMSLSSSYDERCLRKICRENHHHHKHQGLDPLIRSVSKVTTALSQTETFG